MLTVVFLQILLIAFCCSIVKRSRTSVCRYCNHEETAHTIHTDRSFDFYHQPTGTVINHRNKFIQTRYIVFISALRLILNLYTLVLSLFH